MRDDVMEVVEMMRGHKQEVAMVYHKLDIWKGHVAANLGKVLPEPLDQGACEDLGLERGDPSRSQPPNDITVNIWPSFV
jgi:hypothetical protein